MAGLAVVIAGRLVHRQKAEGLLIVDPYRQWAPIEQEAVPLFRLAQRLERAFALDGVAVRRVVHACSGRRGVERGSAPGRNVGEGARLNTPEVILLHERRPRAARAGRAYATTCSSSASTGSRL